MARGKQRQIIPLLGKAQELALGGLPGVSVVDLVVKANQFLSHGS